MENIIEYYDTNLKRHVWVLGYFGGNSINIAEVAEIAKKYAKKYSVDFNSVEIREITESRRFKFNKIIFSPAIQKPSKTAEQMENVIKWLTD